jgi:hypothetical protein
MTHNLDQGDDFMSQSNKMDKNLKSLVRKVKQRFDEKSLENLSSALASYIVASRPKKGRSVNETSEASIEGPPLDGLVKNVIVKSPVAEMAITATGAAHKRSASAVSSTLRNCPGDKFTEHQPKVLNGASRHQSPSTNAITDVKRSILVQASSGKSRPDVPGVDFNDELARSLVSMCSPWSREYDPEFAKSLNSVRPDWFRLTLAPVKQFLPHVELGTEEGESFTKN